MVVDTTYYRAKTQCYRTGHQESLSETAITTHPDKNPGDETAHARFQAIREAYQVLNKEDPRKRYDQLDTAEFYGMISGGEAFIDLVGELSLMKDYLKAVHITEKQKQEEEKATLVDERQHVVEEASSSRTAESKSPHVTPGRPSVSQDDPPREQADLKTADLKPPVNDSTPTASGSSTPRRNYAQYAIMGKSEEDARMDAAGITAEEKELRKKAKRKRGLSREQREKLAAYEPERKRIRDERVDKLAKKLLDRLSILTETDMGSDFITAFQEKTRLEVQSLKMESFAIEILHAIGNTYLQKANSFLKSQNFLGISGFFSRLKDKGTLAKDTWSTISTAVDSQMTIEKMAKLEEKGG